MKYNYILFDLDGTLLPMDQDVFIKTYFGLLAKKAAPFGYEPEKLIGMVWAGTKAMVKNDGSRLNDAVFWECFADVYGEEALKDQTIFDDFYEKNFDQAQVSTGFNPEARKTVDAIKAAGVKVVLATNPVFPRIATEKRTKWAGLSVDEFELMTSYENIGLCKPNPEYYSEILRRLGAKPEECLMVGNDVDEDMVAGTLGMDVFLLTDCLINKSGADTTQYPHGDFNALQAFLFE